MMNNTTERPSDNACIFTMKKIVHMEKSLLSTISSAKVCLNRLFMIFYAVVILVGVFWTEKALVGRPKFSLKKLSHL